ncbi:ABC transporter permease [Actinopolymorpha singaporensis]|uniref:ABC-2 type transport system permease protein n=1 Tax=Actinopolymorpha singaporensis TaxID=117157 RepID=A0A1H1WUB4_9ACTN|nr:ABC-2 family transporter protein [Actinopolymorpha singaporensis]SDT00773.1 ABC-2 type transport system permease protein [Actinopolymorpha singaporensis]
MRVYAAIAWRTFRRYSTYRAATAAGVFTNTVFGFIMAFTYIALWRARPSLGGYDVTDAVTYVWLGQSLGMVGALWGGGFREELAERIRTGDIAVDLYRPVDLQAWWLASDLGRAAFHLLGRGIGPTLVGAFAFTLNVPGDLATWLAFLLSVFLGAVVCFSLNYLFTLAGFWLMDARGVHQLAGVLAMFFSGMLLPLNVFPGWLGDLARALPWSSALQIPADVFLGKRQGSALVLVLAFQAGWGLVLWLAGRALTQLATRKVVVQGG